MTGTHGSRTSRRATRTLQEPSRAIVPMEDGR
jgi:hypothetical protein